MHEHAILLHGDALEQLRELPDESIDALVTDPPAGISFMGKGWDSDKGGRDEWIAWLASIMREALRVLKPGGHALVWALPRTSHWTATAIEDAGFEIRDVVAHLYGSGFPKSLDVSKAIDKAKRRDFVIAAIDLGLCVPGNSLHDWTKGEHAPGDAWWDAFKRTLTHQQWGAVEREVIGAAHRKATGRIEQGSGGYAFREDFDVTAPATDDAKRWHGFGTALKPAREDWILARKPLDGTVAANVLAHGVGALNIDGCRIAYVSDADREAGRPVSYAKAHDGFEGKAFKIADRSHRDPAAEQSTLGRWPANLTLDEEAARVLDEQSGTVAARFFYVAKPSTAERDRGLEGLPVRTAGELTDREEGSAGISPRAGARGERRNVHPTVKPIALMRWLVRLITPPGGIVLDCFAGSGTTGIAAIEEGFGFVGIERDADYFEILSRRVASAKVAA